MRSPRFPGSFARLAAFVVAVMVAASCSASLNVTNDAAPAPTADESPATPTAVPEPDPTAEPDPTPAPDPTAAPTEEPIDDDGDPPDEGEGQGGDLAGRFSLRDSDCEFDAPAEADVSCHRLTVPERWDLDDGATIELAVAVFNGDGVDPDATPVLYLDGGPGSAALDGASRGYVSTWADVAAVHPLVVFDQRGTGYSTPSLQCDETVALARDLAGEADEEVAEQLELEAFTDCIDRLRADEVDFSAYNSVQSAHDVEALRLALESEAWNVVGVSYGTRLGQTLMREHPEGVRAIVLDAVLPIDGSQAAIPATMARSLALLFEGCEADNACAATYPGLEDRFWTLVDELDESPIEFVALDPLNGVSFDVSWTGADVMGVVFQMLYSDVTIADIPLLIEQLERGEVSGASTMAGQSAAQQEFLSVGMFWAVSCHEEFELTTAADYSAGLSGDARIDDVFATGQSNPDDVGEVCEIVQAGVADPIENVAIDSDLPTLVLSGAYDPITPPAFGQDVADDLTNSTHIVLPDAGHGAVGLECGREMILGFFADPSADVATDCLAEIPSIPFVPNDDVADAELATFTLESVLSEPVNVDLPSDWESQGDGVVVEDRSFLRSGIVIALTAPTALLPDLPGLLFGQLEAEELGSESFEAGGRTWTRTTALVPGSTLDVFTAEIDGAGVGFILQAPPEEQTRLIETVVPTALASLTVG